MPDFSFFTATGTVLFQRPSQTCNNHFLEKIVFYFRLLNNLKHWSISETSDIRRILDSGNSGPYLKNETCRFKGRLMKPINERDQSHRSLASFSPFNSAANWEIECVAHSVKGLAATSRHTYPVHSHRSKFSAPQSTRLDTPNLCLQFFFANMTSGLSIYALRKPVLSKNELQDRMFHLIRSTRYTIFTATWIFP